MELLLLFIFSLYAENSSVETWEQVNSRTYQTSQKNWTKIFLSNRETHISCEGDKLIFHSEITDDSINKLLKLAGAEDQIDLDAIKKRFQNAGISFESEAPVMGKCSKDFSHIPIVKSVRKERDFKDKEGHTPAFKKSVCQPKMIEVSSEGGEIDAAAKLYTLVSELGLKVTIPEDGICMSACTNLPLFASEFIASPEALFMFHSVHVNGLPIVQRIGAKSCNQKSFFDDQYLLAYWKMTDRLPSDIKKGVRIHKDFFVRFSVAKNLGYDLTPSGRSTETQSIETPVSN